MCSVVLAKHNTCRFTSCVANNHQPQWVRPHSFHVPTSLSLVPAVLTFLYITYQPEHRGSEQTLPNLNLTGIGDTEEQLLLRALCRKP